MARGDVNKIRSEDFCTMFRCTPEDLAGGFLEKIARMDTAYRPATQKEWEDYVLKVLKKMQDPYVTRSREENLAAFERGWQENLALLMEKGPLPSSLKPQYFQPSSYLRYRKGLIVSENHSLEHDTFTLATMILFQKYLSGFANIYELGSGSCQNLLMLSEMFPDKALFGLDWAESSVEIAQRRGASLNRPISGMIFDMTAPPRRRIIEPGSAVVTVHSLEQLGTQFEKLLAWLRASRPGLIIHYEPVQEFYDEDNLLDYLALMYCRKRGYLTGYLTALQCLERERKIEILGAWRPHLGGVIHEASLIIWRPLAIEGMGKGHD